MKKWHLKAATLFALGSMAIATPASASIYKYYMDNSTKLTIDTVNLTGSWVGPDIDVQMTSHDFAHFEGGYNPPYLAVLASLEGTRIIDGVTYTSRFSQLKRQQLFSPGVGGRWRLLSDWTSTDPVGHIDYEYATITSELFKDGKFVPDPGGPLLPLPPVSPPSAVPAPGMLALFGMGLAAIGLRTRRRRKAVTA